jgi:hypothetical protein
LRPSVARTMNSGSAGPTVVLPRYVTTGRLEPIRRRPPASLPSSRLSCTCAARAPTIATHREEKKLLPDRYRFTRVMACVSSRPRLRPSGKRGIAWERRFDARSGWHSGSKAQAVRRPRPIFGGRIGIVSGLGQKNEAVARRLALKWLPPIAVSLSTTEELIPAIRRVG